MKNVTISLPDDLLEKLRKEASGKQMSLNAWLREVLSDYVEPGESFVEEHARLVAEMSRVPQEPWKKQSRDEMYDEILGLR